MHTYVQSETHEKYTFENAIIRINRNEKWKKSQQNLDCSRRRSRRGCRMHWTVAVLNFNKKIKYNITSLIIFSTKNEVQSVQIMEAAWMKIHARKIFKTGIKRNTLCILVYTIYHLDNRPKEQDDVTGTDTNTSSTVAAAPPTIHITSQSLENAFCFSLRWFALWMTRSFSRNSQKLNDGELMETTCGICARFYSLSLCLSHLKCYGTNVVFSCYSTTKRERERKKNI